MLKNREKQGLQPKAEVCKPDCIRSYPYNWYITGEIKYAHTTLVFQSPYNVLEKIQHHNKFT